MAPTTRRITAELRLALASKVGRARSKLDSLRLAAIGLQLAVHRVAVGRPPSDFADRRVGRARQAVRIDVKRSIGKHTTREMYEGGRDLFVVAAFETAVLDPDR